MKTSVKFIKVNHPDVHTGSHIRDVVIQDEFGQLKSTLLLKLIKEKVTAKSMPVELVKELLEDRKEMKCKYSALKQENAKLKQEIEKMKKGVEHLIDLA